MAQKVYWSWKDDDLTIDINQWLIGMLPAGVYRGFDFDRADQSSMILHLTHKDTGYTYTLKDTTASGENGVLKTKQGAVVKEDTQIDIVIPTADPTHPRIDTVYCTHQYIETKGGAAATYGVISGTPTGTPTAPPLANTELDLLIGYLYIPAAITTLGDSRVLFTKSATPDFANINYARRDSVNRYTSQQQVSPEETATYDSGFSLLSVSRTSNQFVTPSGATNHTIHSIISIPADSLNPTLPAGTELEVRLVGDTIVDHVVVPDVGEIYNNVDKLTGTFVAGTILYFRSQPDKSWLLYNYSVQNVFNRTNVFTPAQQGKYSSDIKIVSTTYTNGSSYTAFILELGSGSNYFELDLANSGQIGSYNPTSSTLDFFIRLKAGNNFKNNGEAFKAFIYVKGSGSQRLYFKRPAVPFPIVNTGYLLPTNDLLGLTLDAAGSTAQWGLPYNRLIEFTVNADGTFFFEPPSGRVLDILGGNGYSNTAFFNYQDSHRAALEKTAAYMQTFRNGAQLNGNFSISTQNNVSLVNASYASTGIGRTISGNCLFTFSITGNVNLADFYLNTPWEPAINTGVIFYGAAYQIATATPKVFRAYVYFSSPTVIRVVIDSLAVGLVIGEYYDLVLELKAKLSDI